MESGICQCEYVRSSSEVVTLTDDGRGGGGCRTVCVGTDSESVDV
jgi:hypothetical protein